jgi:uncharacterized delta-60 repeat protein
MLRVLSIALVVTSFLLGLTSSVQAAAGDLDPSFGTGGFVTTDFGSRDDFGVGAAIQPDGKIVVAGNSGAVGAFAVDFALARYNPDGSLDTTFGSGGIARSDFGAPLDAASDVVVQPDGKLVAAGLSAGNFAVARYNPDGSLDATFGSNGLSIIDFGSNDQANAIILQADGKLVAAGFTLPPSFAGDFALARLNANGSLDTTFGNGGKVTTEFGSFDLGFDAAVTADGRIVVAGRTGDDFALARYDMNGTLDGSFGIGGKVTTNLGGSDQPFAIALDAAGRVIAAGTSSNDFALARYNADGSLDAGFGVGGTVTTDFAAGSSDTAFGVVVQPGGGITAAGGSSSVSGSSSFALARYDSTGNLDASFGAGGKVTTAFPSPLSNALDLLTQPDGKVVAIGGTRDLAVSGSGDFALVRYLGAPSAITVVVDVKPGNEDNVVPLKSNGVVTVAILTTDSFDAATVDPASVCFGDAEDPAQRACNEKHGQGHLVDVNGDGRPDLLLHYDVEQTGIDAGDVQACLTGETHTGNAIEGCDRIVTK